MRLVLDASAAVEILINRDGSRRMAAMLSEAEQVSAPDLLIPEVTNALWKNHHLAGLPLDICDAALSRLPRLVTRLVSSGELHLEAFRLARSEQTPAYDMFYLALAKREDAVLLTLDSRLKKLAKREGVRIE